MHQLQCLKEFRSADVVCFDGKLEDLSLSFLLGCIVHDIRRCHIFVRRYLIHPPRTYLNGPIMPDLWLLNEIFVKILVQWLLGIVAYVYD